MFKIHLQSQVLPKRKCNQVVGEGIFPSSEDIIGYKQKPGSFDDVPWFCFLLTINYSFLPNTIGISRQLFDKKSEKFLILKYCPLQVLFIIEITLVFIIFILTIISQFAYDVNCE